jgi:hypothetical protein
LVTLAAADQDDSGFGSPLVILACLLFAGIGLWGLVRDVSWLLRWPMATGTVVDSIPIGDEGTRAPVVEFHTSQGLAVRASDGVYTRWGKHPIGRTLPVRYDEHDPQRVLVGYRRVVMFGLLLVWTGGAAVFLITHP